MKLSEQILTNIPWGEAGYSSDYDYLRSISAEIQKLEDENTDLKEKLHMVRETSEALDQVLDEMQPVLDRLRTGG